MITGNKGFFYTPLTKKALALSFKAHKNQKDKSGMPYFFHPVHLAEQMETEEEICVALLHDVAEDTEYTLDDLKEMGFPVPVTDALFLLTRTDDLTYMDYVRRLKPNPIARKVKLADLYHNSDLNRLDSVTERDLKRNKKYAEAVRILLENET